MKTLLITTASVLAMLATGCESADSAESSTQPANQTRTQSVDYQMTPSEKRVMQMQALDRQYGEGGMTEGEYQMRQEQIMGQY